MEASSMIIGVEGEDPSVRDEREDINWEAMADMMIQRKVEDASGREGEKCVNEDYPPNLQPPS